MNKKYIFLILVVLFIIACVTTTIYPTKPKQFAEVTGIIYDPIAGTGGTAVIYYSDKTGTRFITNKHVCLPFLENRAAKVVLSNIKYDVLELLLYKNHDLCVFSIQEDLKINIEISSDTVEDYDEVVVSGFPMLRGHIIEKGYVSNAAAKVIAADMMFCWAEKLVNIRCEEHSTAGEHSKAIYIKAFITFGSSGSPVFNTNGELIGIIFAKATDSNSSEGFNYAYAVPLESIKTFLQDIDKKSFILMRKVQ